jgi:malate:quinone-oxidoreductase
MDGFRGSEADIVLVGAGIMSATLATFLKELEPSLRIEVFETLDGAALESSDAWNNAGTGHAALCELNYTPERPDGSIDISKALEVNVEFDLSRQLWSYLVRKGVMNPASFVHPVPHMSFVRGAANVSFLKKRHAALTAHRLYHGMEFTEDKKTLTEWIPLVMEGRPAGEEVAATRMITGADLNYGALTRNLFGHLAGRDGFAIHYRHRVTNLRRDGSGWRVEARHAQDGTEKSVTAKFVFLGAGGGAILLLQKSGIPESDGYAGFPVSGIWLLRYSALILLVFPNFCGAVPSPNPSTQPPPLRTAELDSFWRAHAVPGGAGHGSGVMRPSPLPVVRKPATGRSAGASRLPGRSGRPRCRLWSAARPWCCLRGASAGPSPGRRLRPSAPWPRRGTAWC